MSGTDLNPLLQDFAFTIHPPILYLGYAGLIIPFSLALARCFNVSEGWTMHIRNWTVISWSFLIPEYNEAGVAMGYSLGIIIGIGFQIISAMLKLKSFLVSY